ncbi:unnamed protein product [Coccothraustes coccothraustes]
MLGCGRASSVGLGVRPAPRLRRHGLGGREGRELVPVGESSRPPPEEPQRLSLRWAVPSRAGLHPSGRAQRFHPARERLLSGARRGALGSHRCLPSCGLGVATVSLPTSSEPQASQAAFFAE